MPVVRVSLSPVTLPGGWIYPQTRVTQDAVDQLLPDDGSIPMDAQINSIDMELCAGCFPIHSLGIACAYFAKHQDFTLRVEDISRSGGAYGQGEILCRTYTNAINNYYVSGTSTDPPFVLEMYAGGGGTIINPWTGNRWTRAELFVARWGIARSMYNGNAIVTPLGRTVPPTEYGEFRCTVMTAVISYSNAAEPGSPSSSASPSFAPIVTTLPDSQLVSSTPPICCDPEQVNKANTPGVLPPAISTDWEAHCVGGGTVPEAPDIVDPESWIS